MDTEKELLLVDSIKCTPSIIDYHSSSRSGANRHIMAVPPPTVIAVADTLLYTDDTATVAKPNRNKEKLLEQLKIAYSDSFAITFTTSNCPTLHSLVSLCTQRKKGERMVIS